MLLYFFLNFLFYFIFGAETRDRTRDLSATLKGSPNCQVQSHPSAQKAKAGRWSVWPACTSVHPACLVPVGVGRGYQSPLELHMVVSHHVGAGNRT